MIIDTEKVKETLFNENIPVRRLAKDTGIGASTISQLRFSHRCAQAARGRYLFAGKKLLKRFKTI